jgi:hypothetical protein
MLWLTHLMASLNQRFSTLRWQSSFWPRSSPPCHSLFNSFTTPTAFGLFHFYTDWHFMHCHDMILRACVSLSSFNNNLRLVVTFAWLGFLRNVSVVSYWGGMFLMQLKYLYLFTGKLSKGPLSVCLSPPRILTCKSPLGRGIHIYCVSEVSRILVYHPV